MVGISRVAAIAAAMFLCVFGAAKAQTLPAPATAMIAKPLPLNLDAIVDAAAQVSKSVPTDSADGPADDLSAPLAQAAEKALTGSLPDLVSAHMDRAVSDAEHECLAGAVYFEARGEPLEGQLAVAEVILNRVRSGKYPPTICGVVTQKSQFSFVRRGRIPPIAKKSRAWRKAVAVAHLAKAELADGGVGEAMFFHARYVSPRWRLNRVASIGNHVFYSH